MAQNLLTGSPAWLQGLVIHGLIAGVGTVLTLIPILIIFFAAMGLLEDLGYMARAAFVMDRFMHSMGLHGKSFLPLFMGFGCNVPAVMGARIIEDPKARLATILITPLVPCTARLAVMAVLAPIFFGNSAFWVSWGLDWTEHAHFAGSGVLFHELFLGGEHKAFIMELPLYHLPNRKTILQSVSIRSFDFLRTAGSVILVMSVVLWALSTFPGGNIHTSYLAGVGRLLAPVGSWMGLDWRMMVALLSSFVRKENTIPTLAVLFGAGEQNISLASALSGSMTTAAALAFLTVQILFIPACYPASISPETGSWRWTIIDFCLILALSLVAGSWSIN
jgi:ferrous iron transport protein B